MIGPEAPTSLGRLAQRGRRTLSMTFAFDPNEGARHAGDREAVNLAEVVHSDRAGRASAAPFTIQTASDALDQARARLAVIEAPMVTITVDLRALSRERLDELAAEYPPTRDQIDRARAAGADLPMVDEDEHLPALLAEAITRMTMSDDPAHEIRGRLPIDAVKALLAACSDVDRNALTAAALQPG